MESTDVRACASSPHSTFIHNTSAIYSSSRRRRIAFGNFVCFPTNDHLSTSSVSLALQASQRARARAREVEKRRGAEKNRFCRWQLSLELLLLCKQAIASGTPVCDLSQWSKSFPLKSWCFGLMGFCAPIALGSRVTTNGKWTVEFIAEVFWFFG